MKAGDKLANRELLRSMRYHDEQRAAERGPAFTMPPAHGAHQCATCPRTISANKTHCFHCQRAREESEQRQ